MSKCSFGKSIALFFGKVFKKKSKISKNEKEAARLPDPKGTPTIRP